MSDRDWNFIPLYGGAFQEARASGDAQAMRTVIERAEKEGSLDPELQKALQELIAELEKLEGKRWPWHVMYGVALQQARLSGDLQQMQSLAQRARSEGAGDPGVQEELPRLEAEIARLRGGGEGGGSDGGGGYGGGGGGGQGGGGYGGGGGGGASQGGGYGGGAGGAGGQGGGAGGAGGAGGYGGGGAGGGGGYDIRPLYGVAIQEAISSGDVQQMRSVAQRAQTEGASDPEVQSALKQLHAEIDRASGGKGGSGDGATARTLYGPAIQHARASGDLQQMREVARRAETEGAGDADVQSALSDLRSEISRLESSGG